MAKEGILNSAMNRFQLNFKRNVGAVAENIRNCSPNSLEQWKTYYFKNVKSEEHIIELGKRLYIKITEVIQAEVENISEQDCIDYMIQLVIDRTYDGYVTEIQTIYGQLQHLLNTNISPASDDWDRKFNVDFYIQINNNFIGLQIKPVNSGKEGSSIQLPQIFKEHNIQLSAHKKFTHNFGGKVFYIYSHKINGKKTIYNSEVIDEIINEIARLQTL